MKTSFGEMEILLKDGPKPRVEYLRFEATGRPHKHPEYEYFFVTQGSGKVYLGENFVAVKPGHLVPIPPNTSHWMEPDAGVILEGLLWYHEQNLVIYTG